MNSNPRVTEAKRFANRARELCDDPNYRDVIDVEALVWDRTHPSYLLSRSASPPKTARHVTLESGGLPRILHPRLLEVDLNNDDRARSALTQRRAIMADSAWRSLVDRICVDWWPSEQFDEPRRARFFVSSCLLWGSPNLADEFISASLFGKALVVYILDRSIEDIVAERPANVEGRRLRRYIEIPERPTKAEWDAMWEELNDRQDNPLVLVSNAEDLQTLVQDLHKAGQSSRQIEHRLGLRRETVRYYLLASDKSPDI